MIARKSALIIIINLLNGLLGYVALFFIARFMTPSDYGIVAFATGFVSLFAILGVLGFNDAHIKRVSEGKDLGRCIGTFLASKIGLITIMTAITLGSIIFWKYFLGRGFETTIHETAIYIILVYWVIKLIAETFLTTYRGKKEIAKAEIPLFFETLIRVVVTIYVALAGFGAIELAFTYVAGGVALFITSLLFSKGLPIKRPNRLYFKEYYTFAFPLIIVSVCSTIMTNIDRILLQLFWSSAEVGYYFAGFRLSRFILICTVAVGALLFPTISALHAKKNIEAIRKLTLKSERYLSLIVFPMVVGMIILAEPASVILLSGWSESIPIMQILPIMALFVALILPYNSQFLGMNKPNLARNRILIMVCVNVSLNLILIPRDIQSLGITLAGLGAKGAAIATVISYAVGLIYVRIVVWKLSKIKGSLNIILHALASALMGFILYVMLYYYNFITYVTRWYHLVGLTFLGLGIYLSILILLREFKKEDFELFMDIINIKKMIRYINKELRKK